VSSPDPTGSVYVELVVTGRWAISYLVKNWSVEDRQALLNGSKDAWTALREAAAEETLASPDDVDTESVRIHAEWKAARGAL
jgi:hypothetical protein